MPSLHASGNQQPNTVPVNPCGLRTSTRATALAESRMMNGGRKKWLAEGREGVHKRWRTLRGAQRKLANVSVYRPDREPAGYWEWLHKQQPELLVDVAKLRTREDWVKAGEMAFRTLTGATFRTELAQNRRWTIIISRIRL